MEELDYIETKIALKMKEGGDICKEELNTQSKPKTKKGTQQKKHGNHGDAIRALSKEFKRQKAKKIKN